MSNSLWVEKYRPDTLEGYIGNEYILEKVKIYIQNEDVPHLLLYGSAGTGKTTLAKIITNNIDCDLMYINASDENGVDAVRDKIKGFASSKGFRKWKVIILDEADYLTHQGQSILRNLMETFSTSTRFILTCNYVEKILDPIQSRCQAFAITPPSKKEVAKRLNTILTEEGVGFEMADLVTVVNSGYPDIRRVLNAAQQQVVNGNLVINKELTLEVNYADKVVQELISKNDAKTKFTNIRQIIADSGVKSFEPLYRTLYDRVDEYAGGKVGQTILNIADGQYKDVMVVDKEINTMAMILNIITSI
jgi:DNA polymerase III delta prime subunit